MKILQRSPTLLASIPVLLFTIPALAEQVLSTFIYTHHGERTPWVSHPNPVLTPLGAQQLYQAGINMRRRYVQYAGLLQNSFTIRDISSVFLNNQQIVTLASSDQWSVASAMAFMQGLYPPLTDDQNYTTIQGISDLYNGTNIVAPLGGYQYPDITTASTFDYESIFVRGSQVCPAFNLAMIDYYSSSTYNTIRQQTQGFYDTLDGPLLDGVLDDSAIGYFDAYYIWDYLSYGYVHNTTIRRKLSEPDYTAARILAADWMLDMYANNTKDGTDGNNNIRTIAGQGLASYIVRSFIASIQKQGTENKMTLVFGDFTPMMSFFALTKLLTKQTGAFFNPPAQGASMIFELFTMTGNTSSAYPKTTDMFVRFLYQNATDSSSSLIQYPLFGLSPSQATMSWADFTALMSGIELTTIQEWCTLCGSAAIFCSSSDESTPTSDSARHGLQPAVAGVIGAVVALIFIGLVLALVMLLGGVRFQRQGRRTSQLGGFKGAEKMRSDQDLTLPKGGMGVSVSEEPRGHERVGSWELKEPVNVQSIKAGIDTAALRRASHDLDHDDTMVDPYAIPVKPHDAV